MKRIFFLFIPFIFGGCSWFTEIVEVPLYTVQRKAIEVPTPMTEKEIPSRPLSVDKYMSLQPEDKEVVLIRRNMELEGIVKKQNDNLDKIRKWSDQQKALYEQNLTFENIEGIPKD